jgi:large subunit ribosomal protein L9
MDIAEALKERGYEIDRRRITLRDAIKETGEFTVPVRLHREVTVDIPVEVTPEGGSKAAAETPAAAPQTSAEGDETTTEETSEESGASADNS